MGFDIKTLVQLMNKYYKPNAEEDGDCEDLFEENEQFLSGAQRDARAGKGRYDLISPVALDYLARVYEEGANKYGARNWEKGMPVSRYLDSATRHIYQFLSGIRDEDHLGHAMWNIAAAIHTIEMVKRGKLPKELVDLPNYTE